ncbi:hypothetical protein VMT65_27535 [Nocardia sp. CDC153]|uniref:hypothetical protein n=1 Tax=Nocardia sp. CDC153 TaxID=3112167 RepID=UPI002DB61009|nr:hypothetical protein [Nocardia sp. CDC153]MEC3956818.1 hypothetical protein [Nocardia sp. CDC153]
MTTSSPVRLTAILLLAATVILGTGTACSTPTRSTPTTATTTPASTIKWTAESLTTAFAAINQKLGPNPEWTRLDIANDGTSMSIEAVDPTNRDSIIKYHYTQATAQAELEQTVPNPAELREQRGVGTFTSSEISLDTLLTIEPKALRDTAVRDGHVWDYVIGRRTNPPAFLIEVTVYGSDPVHDEKLADYDMTGKLISVS